MKKRQSLREAKCEVSEEPANILLRRVSVWKMAKDICVPGAGSKATLGIGYRGNWFEF